MFLFFFALSWFNESLFSKENKIEEFIYIKCIDKFFDFLFFYTTGKMWKKVNYLGLGSY